jgi:hypothetical protein
MLLVIHKNNKTNRQKQQSARFFDVAKPLLGTKKIAPGDAI